MILLHDSENQIVKCWLKSSSAGNTKGSGSLEIFSSLKFVLILESFHITMPKGTGARGVETKFNGLEARAALGTLVQGGTVVNLD